MCTFQGTKKWFELHCIVYFSILSFYINTGKDIVSYFMKEAHGEALLLSG